MATLYDAPLVEVYIGQTHGTDKTLYQCRVVEYDTLLVSAEFTEQQELLNKCYLRSAHCMVQNHSPKAAIEAYKDNMSYYPLLLDSYFSIEYNRLKVGVIPKGPYDFRRMLAIQEDSNTQEVRLPEYIQANSRIWSRPYDYPEMMSFRTGYVQTVA